MLSLSVDDATFVFGTFKRYALLDPRIGDDKYVTMPVGPIQPSTRISSGLLILISLRNIQPQSIRIQVQLVLPTSLLQDLRNVPRILNPPQINV